MPSLHEPTRFSTGHRVHRLPQFAMFLGCVVWFYGAAALAKSAANGLAFRLRLVSLHGLLEACFHLFLLLVGFAVLQGMFRQRSTLADLTGLIRRESGRTEWFLGAAVGWGMVVAATLPLVLLRRVRVRLDPGASGLRDAGVEAAILAVVALTREVAFRGLPFRCLTRAVGSFLAVALMVVCSGLSLWRNTEMTGTAVVAGMLLTGLLSMTWLRTHALWMAWGVRFSVMCATTVVFGLPMEGLHVFRSLVRGSVRGPGWLTGGAAGPAGSLIGVVVLIVGTIVLYRLTRDYAWSYTHEPILAGGQAVQIAPPSAHTAMEQQAAVQPHLVQILPVTSANMVTEAAEQDRSVRP